MLDRPGLTLLELIVAVALAGVLAGIALLAHPRMVEDLQLNQAARQVMLDLVAARTRALAEGRGQRLLFRLEEDVYERQQKVGNGYETDGVAVTLARDIDLTGCSALGSAVTFQPRGNATTFGTITLRNRSDHERRVVVDIAGRVRVQ